MTKHSSTIYLDRHETYLHQIITEASFPSARLKEAMIYALFPGGKRVRPMLVYLVGELVEVPLDCLDAIAAAVELTHCYSLVHDDLPAMDNDDMRRGKPSCHRAFDEGTAILAGDALQIHAITLLLEQLSPFLSATQVVQVIQALCHASGPSGMISGQCLDLYELNALNTLNDRTQGALQENDLRQIHALKTGQLIRACIDMVLAASTPNISNHASKPLQQYADYLGLTFQMQDDYLDRYAPVKLGKGRSSDSSNAKLTFADFYTQEALADLINRYYHLTIETLHDFGNKADALTTLTASLRSRL